MNFMQTIFGNSVCIFQEKYLVSNAQTSLFISLFLHRAFWRFIKY